MAHAPKINIEIDFNGCCASCRAAMPAPRRPALTHMLSPEFRPDLALQIIARLEKHITELEQTLATDEMLLRRSRL